MKKVLLFSIFVLSALTVFAYETIIIKYPPGERWEKVYYKKVANEALVQFMPVPDTREDWKRTIIVHSYYESTMPANYFIDNYLAKMMKTNPNGKYKYLKITSNDSIATRCTNDYKDIKAQCEFYRVTYAHDGLVTIHYINRDKEDFMENYAEWYNIIRKVKLYNTYYRDERILDRAENSELW